jgi:phage baseplate assembly protein W
MSASSTADALDRAGSGREAAINDFLGVGWAFPVGVDARGRIALARRERDIEEAMRIILMTPKGQRVMRPDFGCDIHELLFAPNNATTTGLAMYYVEQALAMWEPRIEVKRVRVFPDPAQEGRMMIEIDYIVKATYDSRALVVPFYRIPEEDPVSG